MNLKVLNWKTLNRPVKKLLGDTGGASCGRNNRGRITVWHRGGGSKRKHRVVDLKRKTTAVGIVERIEYDPNRSGRLALVKWIEGVRPYKPKPPQFVPSRKPVPIPVSPKVSGVFPLACLSQDSVRSHRHLREVFFTAFSKHAQQSLVRIPRIAVAGARPEFFAPVMGGQATAGEEKNFALSDLRRWKKDSVIWEHKLKRKAAVPWLSIRQRDMTLGFGKDPVEYKPEINKMKARPVHKGTKPKENRIAVSYIVASDGMEAGSMVMNCDHSSIKPKVW